MALVVKDRVRETSVTQGTGTFTLAGAVTGYQSFSAIGNGNTTYYTIYLQASNEWEVGIGTYTASGTTLSRDTILASSNGGSVVNFSAGTKDVFVTYPAGRSVYYDTATNVSLNALTVAGAFAANGGATLGDASGDALTINSSAVSTPNGLNFDSNTFVIDATNNRIGINNASPTVALDVTGALTISGNAILGDATTDTVLVNGYMSTGGAVNASFAMYPRNTALTGTTQAGVYSAITGASDATSAIYGVVGDVRTAAAAFTVTNVSQVFAADATKGAGSTITNQHGIRIADQTQGTNNFGVTSLVSSGTNKWNIYASGTAANYFAGNVGIGTSTLVSNTNLTVAGSGSGSVTGGGILSLFRPSTSVISSNNLGSIHFTGADTTSNSPTTLAYIRGQASSTHDPGDNPTDLVFGVTADGTETAYDAVRINQAGGIVTNPIAGGHTVFNENGVDADFRVESDTNTHAIFLDAGNSRVGINNSAPTAELDVKGGAVFWGVSTSSRDFEITSDASFVQLQSYNTKPIKINALGNNVIIESNLGLGVTPSAWSSSWRAYGVAGGATLAGRSSNTEELYLSANVYNDGVGWKYIATNFATQYYQDAGTHVWRTAPSGTAGDAVTFTERATIGTSEMVVNDPGNDYDFRVESDTNTHALFVDAGNDRVGIGTSSPVSVLDVAGITPVLTIKDTQSKTWAANDTVGDLDFYSSDTSGTGPRTVARIRSFADNAGTTAAGALSFWTSAADSAATEKMRLTKEGYVLVGTTASLGTAGVQAAAVSTDPFEGYRFGANANGPTVSLYKNRGATVGTNAVVVSGDELGTIAFRGYDGAAYRAGAFITGNVDGTPGASDMPGRLTFSTTADGAATPTERMRIDASGALIAKPAAGTGAVFNEDGVDADFRVESDTNTHALFVDAGNSRVGVGEDAPLGTLHTSFSDSGTYSSSSSSVTTPAGTEFIVQNTSSTTDSGAFLSLRAANSSGTVNYAYIGAVSTSGAHRPTIVLGQRTNSTAYEERLRITSDSVPYLRLASGTGGIQFNGDTAAANALDDYEEGTFTPTIEGTTTAGTGTYTAQVGRYTKIGDRVLYMINLVWSAHTGTGNLRVAGLPFTSESTSNNNNIPAIYNVNIAMTAGNVMQAYISNNSTLLQLRQLPTGGGADASIPMDTAGQVVLSGQYEV